MKANRIIRVLSDLRKQEAHASHMAVGALLIVTILYSALII